MKVTLTEPKNVVRRLTGDVEVEYIEFEVSVDGETYRLGVEQSDGGDVPYVVTVPAPVRARLTCTRSGLISEYRSGDALIDQLFEAYNEEAMDDEVGVEITLP